MIKFTQSSWATKPNHTSQNQTKPNKIEVDVAPILGLGDILKIIKKYIEVFRKKSNQKKLISQFLKKKKLKNNWQVIFF